MTSKVVIVDEVVEPEEIESVHGNFAAYIQMKLKEFVDDPENPKLMGDVTVTISETSSIDRDSVRLILWGFTE